jgi:hypothetical protein
MTAALYVTTASAMKAVFLNAQIYDLDDFVAAR